MKAKSSPVTCNHTTLENRARGDQRERPRCLTSRADGAMEGLTGEGAGLAAGGLTGDAAREGAEAGARAASAA